MALRLVFLLAAFAAISGLRKRRPGKGPTASSLAPPGFANKRTPPRFVNKSSMLALHEEVDCSLYDDLVVGDVPVGKALGPVCRFWPRMGWGVFPFAFDDVDTVVFWLDAAFKEGGLWDRLKELWKERGERSEFCWRDFDLRATTDTPPTCFESRYEHVPDMTGGDRTYEPTKYWCQKRCQMTEGCAHFTYWWDGGCHLADANSYKWSTLLSQTGPPECAESLLQLNASDHDAVVLSDDCEKVYNGKCYGSCPDRFQPALLSKYFAPVCMSVCDEDPSHPVGCGYGCATSVRRCFDTIMSQTSSVVNTVGQAVAYATGHIAVYEVVSELLQITEFVITSLWPLIQIGKDIWALWGESQSVVGFIVVFLAYAQEKAAENGQSLETLVALFQKTMGFWAALADEGITFPDAPLEFIIRTLEEFGMETGDAGDEVDAVWGLIDAFVYPKCDVSD